MQASNPRPILALILTAGMALAAFAQVDVSTATLQGTISDPTHAVIPGARVTARSVTRGTERSATSDARGGYHIPLLQPGAYEILVEAKGFESQIIKSVVLTIGQELVYDLELAVGDVSSRVEVTAAVPLIETERTQQANTIEQKQIASLPLVTRTFTDLVFTLPGVVTTEAARAQNTRIGTQRSSGISVGGGNGRTNYFTIDGGENELGTGGLRVRNMSVEAVQEFQVNRNAYAAEYGFTAGTAINVITKSGTNTFHGSGYVFYRSQKTSARNPFDFAPNKSFQQRLFPGVTVGGPIIRNKAFFFSSYEALKLDETRFRTYTSNPAPLQITAAQTAFLNLLTNGSNASEATRAIAAYLERALTLSPATLDFLKSNEGNFPLHSRTHNWTSRLDYQINNRNTLNGRFTLADENNAVLSLDALESPGRGETERQRDYTMVGTWSRSFNNGLINQARIQFVKDKLSFDPVSLAPSINIAGIINYGRGTVVPNYLDQKRYQFEDIVSWSRSSHSLKFGLLYRPIDLKVYNEIGSGGFYQFAGGLPLILLVREPDRAVLSGPNAPTSEVALTAMQTFNSGLPQVYQQGFGDPLFTGVQHNLGVFAQDSWKVTSRLTLDIGVRFNYDGEPKPLFVNQNFSPRVGFAWDVRGNGRTVVRGGGGTFYSPVAAMIFGAVTLQNDTGDHLVFPTRTIQSGEQSTAVIWDAGVRAGKLPYTPLSASDLTALGITIGPKLPGRRIAEANTDYQNPSSVQASLGVSHQLARDLAIEVAYLMHHGVHLPMGVEGNYLEAVNPMTRCNAINPNPANQPLACQNPALYGPVLEPIDPTISQFVKHTSWGNSIYHGMTASLNKRYSNNHMFQINYTFGKAIDDVIDFQGPGTPFLPTRRFLDRGLSTYDIRHNFVASGVFSSPFNNAVLRDLTLSPIVNIRSGVPFTLYIGRDANGDPNTTDRPFYAPRNSGVGPAFYTVNLRLSKRFQIPSAAVGESGIRVEFIAEATNLLNQTNFLRVNDNVCGATCDPKFLTGPFDFRGSRHIPAAAPLGFTAAHPGRQLQLGLKLEF